MTEVEKKINSFANQRPLAVEGIRQWINELDNEEPDVIMGVMAGFNEVGGQSSIDPAIRDTLRSLLDVKLNANLISTMKQLNATATRLSKLSLWLTVAIGVAGLIIAIAGIIIPLFTRYNT